MCHSGYSNHVTFYFTIISTDRQIKDLTFVSDFKFNFTAYISKLCLTGYVCIKELNIKMLNGTLITIKKISAFVSTLFTVGINNKQTC